MFRDSVVRMRKFDHITPALRDLCWLSVRQELYLRDAIFAFKCLTGCALDYLRSKLVSRGQASGRVTRNSHTRFSRLLWVTAAENATWYAGIIRRKHTQFNKNLTEANCKISKRKTKITTVFKPIKHKQSYLNQFNANSNPLLRFKDSNGSGSEFVITCTKLNIWPNFRYLTSQQALKTVDKAVLSIIQ